MKLYIVGFIILAAIFLRERSWRNTLSAKEQQIAAFEVNVSDLKQFLTSEQEKSSKFHTALFLIASRCYSDSDTSSSSEVNSSGESSLLFKSNTPADKKCLQEILDEFNITVTLNEEDLLKLAQNDATTLNSFSLLETHQISLIPKRLFDKSGWCLIALFISIILSEFILVYNIWDGKSEITINRKKYDKFDFIDRKLFQQFQLYLIKEQPITSFYFCTALYFSLLIIYLLSWVISFSNVFYYNLIVFVLKLMILFLFTRFTGFFIFNFKQLYHYFRKYYPDGNILHIFKSEYRKSDFWIVIFHKVFFIYDFYQGILFLLWFVCNLSLMIPLMYFYYYYDVIYAHTDMSGTSGKVNSVNNFMLITWLHSIFPMVVFMYFSLLTLVLPFVRIGKNSTTNSPVPKSKEEEGDEKTIPFVFEQLLFSEKNSYLKSILNFLISKRVFLREEFTAPGATGDPLDAESKINDQTIGVVVFVAMVNSGIYLLRFLYYIYFVKITTTWFSWFMTWFYLLFHVFIGLCTLPIVNLLLTKLELIKKYRLKFKLSMADKMVVLSQELKATKMKMKKDPIFEELLGKSEGNEAGEGEWESLKEDQLIEQEISDSLNLFDFSLHKAVLFRLFVHEEKDTDPEEKVDKDNKDTARFDRIFQNVLQKDAFLYGKKFGDGDIFENEEDGEEYGEMPEADKAESSPSSKKANQNDFDIDED
jgi:hypothetical protein